MKRLGKTLFGCVIAALLALACRSLIARPPTEDEPIQAMPPARAVLHAAVEASAAEDALAQPRAGTPARRLTSALAEASAAPVCVPTRDGNGTPLVSRPYVRTVYTACRLQDTSG